jgi:hypothetical protein
MKELKTLRDESYLHSSQFFTYDYIDISLDGNGEEFK